MSIDYRVYIYKQEKLELSEYMIRFQELLRRPEMQYWFRADWSVGLYKVKENQIPIPFHSDTLVRYYNGTVDMPVASLQSFFYDASKDYNAVQMGLGVKRFSHHTFDELGKNQLDTEFFWGDDYITILLHHEDLLEHVNKDFELRIFYEADFIIELRSAYKYNMSNPTSCTFANTFYYINELRLMAAFGVDKMIAVGREWLTSPDKYALLYHREIMSYLDDLQLMEKRFKYCTMWAERI